jgi:hypothetical protein
MRESFQSLLLLMLQSSLTEYRAFSVYNYCRGNVGTCHTSLCEAQALATVLHLHEEEVNKSCPRLFPINADRCWTFIELCLLE